MTYKVEVTPEGNKLFSLEIPEAITKEAVERHIKELEKKYKKKRKRK